MIIRQDYDLKIAIDVGYSASKVCINGIELFTIPSDIVEINANDTYLLDMHQPDYICTSYVAGQSHLVGAQAASLLMEQSYRDKYNEIRDTMISYKRFLHNDAHIHLMTCIGMALIKYSEYTMDNENVHPVFDIRKDLKEGSLFKIYIILGYPHDVFAKTFQSVKPNLAKRHKFSIETENDTYNLDFAISAKHVMSYSQALAAYMGTVLDDNGELLEDSPHFKKLPALLIDGGWKTLGKFVLTKNLKIEAAESNTDFAMKNVYQKIIEVLRNEYGREDFEVYNIEEILKNQGGIITAYDAETDQTSSVDINEMFNKFKDEICSEMIEYLNERHNKMRDIQEIIIAGGTGAAYYDSFMDYINQKRGHLSKDIYLINYEFNGVKIETVYAVVVGLYKVLLHTMNSARETE